MYARYHPGSKALHPWPSRRSRADQRACAPPIGHTVRSRAHIPTPTPLAEMSVPAAATSPAAGSPLSYPPGPTACRSPFALPPPPPPSAPPHLCPVRLSSPVSALRANRRRRQRRGPTRGAWGGADARTPLQARRHPARGAPCRVSTGRGAMAHHAGAGFTDARGGVRWRDCGGAPECERRSDLVRATLGGPGPMARAVRPLTAGGGVRGGAGRQAPAAAAPIGPGMASRDAMTDRSDWWCAITNGNHQWQ